MVKLAHQSKIKFLGEELNVEFSERVFLKARVVRTKTKVVVFRGEDKKNFKKILNEWLVEESRAHIEKRAKHFAKKYDFQFKRVAIKDTVSRWGSCSSQKNLNFNWRLSFAPLKALDYVILHELCHTRQMNHSQSFWKEVSKVMPEYRVAEAWLKDNGGELSVR
ncbi:MAG: M48 family metallopeptidase [Candidatus Dojkabacteria bacterium]